MATVTVGLHVTATRLRGGRRAIALVCLALLVFGVAAASWPRAHAPGTTSPQAAINAIPDDDGHDELPRAAEPGRVAAPAAGAAQVDATADRPAPLTTGATASRRPRAPPSR